MNDPHIVSYLLWEDLSGITYTLKLTSRFYTKAYPSGYTPSQTHYEISAYDVSLTGNLSNSLITYDKPAAVPPALYVADMNISSNNRAGCFSTNLLIGSDTIKIEGRVRYLVDLWKLYGITKWSKSQKVFCIASFDQFIGNPPPTLIDRKVFAVQISDFNWAIKSGFGEEIDFTLNLKVVDQKSDNPIA